MTRYKNKGDLMVTFTPEEYGALQGLLKGVRETEEYKKLPPKGLLRKVFDNHLEAIEEAVNQPERV